jgi:pimeloyl-ACP methyl ester carboxylesterase
MSIPVELRHSRMSIEGCSLHLAECGPSDGPAILFIHGWPHSWRSWKEVMTLAGAELRALAIDLPGIGESTQSVGSGRKSELAAVVHALIAALGLGEVTLVGHDIGGMVAYAYLRRYDDVARVASMDNVIPGVDPWNELSSQIWHFAFHNIPSLPEQLIQGHQAEYFDYFYDELSVDPASIGPQARAAYADAYSTGGALTAGFDLYRAFAQDARENIELAEAAPVETPMLYVRGEHEDGDIATYAKGLREAGVTNLTTALVPGAGHFPPEEKPAELWRIIRDFMDL